MFLTTFSILVESRRKQWELCCCCDYTKGLTFPWERDQRDSLVCALRVPASKPCVLPWGMLLFFCALTLQFGFKNSEETFHAVSSEVPSFLDSSTLTVIRGSGFLFCVLSVALQVHLKHFSGPQVLFLLAAVSGSMSISCFCPIPLSSAWCRDIPWLLHDLPAWLLGHFAASSPPFSPSCPVPGAGGCSVGRHLFITGKVVLSEQGEMFGCLFKSVALIVLRDSGTAAFL